MMNGSSEIRIIVERTMVSDRWIEVLALPVGQTAHIQLDAQESPRLLPQPAENCISMRILDVQPPRIAMKSTALRALVNAVPAPKIAILRPGDEVSVEAFTGWRLHLAVYRAPQADIAGAEAARLACPVCRERFSPQDAVFRCTCGTIFHFQDSAQPDAPISCVRALPNCPDCNQPICLQASLEFSPEGFNADAFLQHDSGAAVAGGV